jgi:hypothetical protein
MTPNTARTLYLVTAEVEVNHYMGSRATMPDMRLVIAASDEEAREKYHRFWDLRSTPYSSTYYAYIEEVSEAIE